MGIVTSFKKPSRNFISFSNIDSADVHRLAVRSNLGGHVGDQCKRCGCKPTLEKQSSIRTASDKTEREVIEARYTSKASEKKYHTVTVIWLFGLFRYVNIRLLLGYMAQKFGGFLSENLATLSQSVTHWRTWKRKRAF